MVFQKTLIILGILFLCSCGREPVLEVGEWGAYVELYEQEAAKYGNPIEITDLRIKERNFDDSRIWGLCTLREGETPLIELSSDKLDMLYEYVDYLGESTVEAILEALMFHELGHCVAGLGHGTVEIMNETMLDAGYYMYYRDELIEEEMIAANHNGDNPLLAKISTTDRVLAALKEANPLQAVAAFFDNSKEHDHKECDHN